MKSSTARNLLAEFQSLESLELGSEEFKFFADKMYQLAGVSLPENDKNYALMKNRLAKLLRTYAFSSYSDLIQKLKTATPELTNEFISCLTTNKTDFFRESYHFEFMQDYLKTHFKSNPDLRIWCSAASTGQEPYTLSMVCHESLNASEMSRTKILATDIDLDALGKAADGMYARSDMSGLPPALEKKYFDEIAGLYRASEAIVKPLHFSQFNLVKGPYQFQKPFHMIFCRNVLIYFDDATIDRVITNLISCLAPGGYLFLGHSESGAMRIKTAKPLSRAIFQKV